MAVYLFQLLPGGGCLQGLYSQRQPRLLYGNKNISYLCPSGSIGGVYLLLVQSLGLPAQPVFPFSSSNTFKLGSILNSFFCITKHRSVSFVDSVNHELERRQFISVWKAKNRNIWHWYLEVYIWTFGHKSTLLAKVLTYVIVFAYPLITGRHSLIILNNSEKPSY